MAYVTEAKAREIVDLVLAERRRHGYDFTEAEAAQIAHMAAQQISQSAFLDSIKLSMDRIEEFQSIPPFARVC